MSPIEWKLSFVKADPQEAARRAAARTPGDGIAVVQKQKDAPVLRFSAVVRTGGLRELALCLAGAFSVSEGIRKDTGIITWLRWPDMVVVDGEVIARSSTLPLQGKGDPRVILGFSVNRRLIAEEGSTSLEDELGVDVDERLLVEKILESLSWMHFGWTNGMQEHVLSRVRSMTETIDKVVSVSTGSAVRRGTAKGIDTAGRLLVELGDGETVKLDAEDELLAE